MWHNILITISLLLVIEGIMPFINPDGLRKALIMISQMNDQTLRFAGLTSMIFGVLLLYLVN